MTPDYITRFREKSDILFTNGGLSALQDYPPHERIYDNVALEQFITTLATEQFEAGYKSCKSGEVVEDINYSHYQEGFAAGKVAGRNEAVGYILNDPDILSLEESKILAAIGLARNQKSI